MSRHRHMYLLMLSQQFLRGKNLRTKLALKVRGILFLLLYAHHVFGHNHFPAHVRGQPFLGRKFKLTLQALPIMRIFVGQKFRLFHKILRAHVASKWSFLVPFHVLDQPVVFYKCKIANMANDLLIMDSFVHVQKLLAVERLVALVTEEFITSLFMRFLVCIHARRLGK